MEIRRLSHAVGAQASGVDISQPLDTATFEATHHGFLEHCVLLFRDQPMTRSQHVAFSRRFGEIDALGKQRAPEHPEVSLVISKPTADGKPPIGRYTGQEWHTDRSHLPIAAAASLLRCVEIPEVGGDTMFCNLYRAYDTLSDGMKKLLDGLYGVHKTGQAFLLPHAEAAQANLPTAAAAHPAVRVHPETGRKVLYVSQQVRKFVGMTSEESKPLLQYLVNHAVQPQNVYRHHWRKNDLLMWDNR
jgi:taurine dioxygenase